MPKKFTVEVPCTTIDRYFIFAESEAEAYEKMAGSMTERTKKHPNGDYILVGLTDHDHESITDWDKAKIVAEGFAPFIQEPQGQLCKCSHRRGVHGNVAGVCCFVGCKCQLFTAAEKTND